MKADDPRAVQWRRLLNEAMAEAAVNQTELARRIGRVRAQIGQWLNEGNRYPPPQPDVVFAIEDALGCRDRLSTTLGYVRTGPVPDVERALQVDPRFSREQRATLLYLCRVLAGRDDGSSEGPPWVDPQAADPASSGMSSPAGIGNPGDPGPGAVFP